MSETLTTMTQSTPPKTRTIIPPPRIAIVDLTPNNIGTLRKLNSVLFPVSYSDKFYHQVLEDYLSDFCKLIYYNDLPVGAVCCRIEPDPKQPPSISTPSNSATNSDEPSNNQIKLYIMTLGVLAPYRQQGLATKLLDQVISAAQKTHLTVQSTSTSNAEGGPSSSNHHNPTTTTTTTTTTTIPSTTTTNTNPSATESKKTHHPKGGKKSTGAANKSSQETVTGSEQPSSAVGNHKSTTPQEPPTEPASSSSPMPIMIPSISTAYVHVQSGNEDAKQFYLNRGFQVDGQISEYYRKIEPRAAWILVKPISPPAV